jgi:gas vesicle protein
MGKSASEVRADIEDTRRDMSVTIDAIADRTSPSRVISRRRQAMSDGWRSVRERVMGRADDAFGAAGYHAQGVAGSARDQAGSLADQARQAPDKLVEQAQGNPIAAGLVAFGGGLLVASLVPPTDAEQRMAGTLREQTQPLQEELKQAGQQVAEDLKSTAQEGAEQVKQRASEAAGTVQEDVRGSAQHLPDEARR